MVSRPEQERCLGSSQRFYASLCAVSLALVSVTGVPSRPSDSIDVSSFLVSSHTSKGSSGG